MGEVLIACDVHHGDCDRQEQRLGTSPSPRSPLRNHDGQQNVYAMSYPTITLVNKLGPFS
jgi:hypothetical protein